MRRYVVADSAKPFLLAADIDGTLLGDENGEACLRELAKAQRNAFILAYISGRSRTSLLRLIDEGRLPKPDYICGDVGTDLVDLGDPYNAIGKRFISQVGREWDLEAIYSIGEGPGISRQDFPESIDRPPPFHAGFHWNSDPEDLKAFYERMKGQRGINIFPAMKVYIDVIPVPLGKGGTVSFLQQELGIDKERVVVAGDSGNDIQMFQTGFKGILPSNALDELKAAAVHGWHYQSRWPATAGVMDGLDYFGFLEEMR